MSEEKLPAKNYYYDMGYDLQLYPNCWCYVVYSGRNTGKTFSTLKYMYDNKCRFAFVKRTNEDVDILCSSSKKIGSARVDLNPWKKINKFYPYIKVAPVKVQKGIGAFFVIDDEGNPLGEPIGYIFSLNAIGDIKGFECEVDYLIFDEFIPKPWERVNRKEGDQVLDLYKTLDRDRIHRGLPATKLILLANPTNINTPVLKTLALIDTMAEYDRNMSYVFEDKGIMIRKLQNNKNFIETEKQHPMYISLKETEWGKMAFDGSFAYNDFSCVKDFSIKKAVPVVSFFYMNSWHYIYQRNGLYMVTSSKFNVDRPSYDLTKEVHQKRFWYEVVIDLRSCCIDGNAVFKTYSEYDLIMNYKEVFKV